MDKAKSIKLLNKAVADELQAVHQYMYFHFHLADQGFGPLSMLFRRIAIMEMGHVELLAERVLFLKGDVEMVAADILTATVPARQGLRYGVAAADNAMRSAGAMLGDAVAIRTVLHTDPKHHHGPVL